MNVELIAKKTKKYKDIRTLILQVCENKKEASTMKVTDLYCEILRFLNNYDDNIKISDIQAMGIDPQSVARERRGMVKAKLMPSLDPNKEHEQAERIIHGRG